MDNWRVFLFGIVWLLVYGLALMKAVGESSSNERAGFNLKVTKWTLLPYLVSLLPLLYKYSTGAVIDVQEIALEIAFFIVLTKVIIYSAKKQ
jgi:hypothetical protein